MFETMLDRAGRLARDHAETRRRQMAARLEAEMPGGVAVEAGEDGVWLAGRGLRRRIALDSRLRALLAEVLR